MHGADRRRLDVVVQAAQLLADLGCTPTRVLAPQSHNQRFDLNRQLVGLPIGSPATVGQPYGAEVLVALEELVAGLARDLELTAQDRHLFATEETGHKPDAFVHLGTLLPRHFALRKVQKCYPCVRNDLLPISREGQ